MKINNHKVSLFDPLDKRPTASAREVAIALGYDISSIHRLAREGELPGAFQVGKWRKWRFRKDVLEAWCSDKAGSKNS